VTTSTPLEKIRGLYHFTDTRNLVSIKKAGYLYSTAKLNEKEIISFHPGGNDGSLKADRAVGMDQYVHLCFNKKHPMEYIARSEGRIVNTAWLSVDRSVIERPGVLFCPDVSNKTGVKPVPIADAAEMIDLEVLYNYINWKENPEAFSRRQAAEKYEILIPNKIPFKYFEKYFPNG
jgi:hypothetical protein